MLECSFGFFCVRRAHTLNLGFNVHRAAKAEVWCIWSETDDIEEAAVCWHMGVIIHQANGI